jgi:hypothetical protein
MRTESALSSWAIATIENLLIVLKGICPNILVSLAWIMLWTGISAA